MLFDTRYAVSFFFVLSGFILCHAHQHFDRARDMASFYAARVSRLWPAHAVTAALAVAFVVPWTAAVLWKLPVNLLLLHGWLPLITWYYSINAVSWSISTEMSFYLVFPFAFATAMHRPWRLVWIALAILAIAIAGATLLGLSPREGDPGVTAWGLLYISPAGRIAEFLAGMASYRGAVWLYGRSVSWGKGNASLIELGTVALTFVAMVACTRAANVLSATLPQLSVWLRVAGPFGFFCLLICVLYGERGMVSKLLQWRPLVYLGETSFALYLLHQLVLRWMFAQFHVAIQANPHLAYAAFWLAALAGASLIHHLVENRFRSPLRRLLSKRSAYGVTGGAEKVEPL